MPDVLIRNFPDDDLALLDEQARRLGISRAEHLRRQLQQAARASHVEVTPADLRDLEVLLPDLADADVMRNAWS